MSDNDRQWVPDAYGGGKLRRGSLGTPDHELAAVARRVIREMESAEHAENVLETVKDHVETLQTKELPMLKGKGFIVVDPANPRFAGEEFEDITDAQDAANNVAYTSQAGYALVYAPIATVRPKREVAISQPSALLKQLQLENKPVAEVKG